MWHIYIYTVYIYSDILSDILSGIYSDILSGILSGIPSGIHSDILSGICAYILSGIPSGIYSDSLSGTYTGTYTGILPGISSGHSFWHSILTSYSDVLSDILSDMGSDNAIWHFMAFYLFCCSGPGAPHCVRSSHYGVRRSQCSKTTGGIAASEGKRKEGRKEGRRSCTPSRWGKNSEGLVPLEVYKPKNVSGRSLTAFNTIPTIVFVSGWCVSNVFILLRIKELK